jgi:predicted permease
VLLVGGGLLLRSFVNVMDVDLGFQPADAVAWRVDTNRNFETRTARAAFYDDLIGRVLAVPGVDAAGMTDTTPLGRNREWGFAVEGVSYDEVNRRPGGFPRIVDHRYLETMGIPLVAGRYFTADDREETTPVMILNQAAATRFFGGEDPIGRRVLNNGPWEVVGVVGDVRHQSLEQGSAPEVYYLSTQQWDMSTAEMVVRAHVPLATLSEGVRRAIREVDAAIPTDDFRTLDSIVDRAVSPRRFTLLLLGAFAASGLLLAALGIYAVLSYNVSQRTSEIGIRMALGQTASSVRGQVVGRTLTLAGVGVVIGAGLSLVLARLIGSLLFGVGATDAVTFVAVSAGLILVAAAAGYLPARRASRTDPVEALRGV